MTWEQIKEVEGNDFANIGHHSHTHEYLIDVSNEEFILDIETANKIFLRELGYVPDLFSYPFGEYSKFMKDYISKNFTYIGHHSHTHEYLIDVNNDDFILDIETANKIFLRELGYVPSLFSYPFGEYSKFMKDFISKNFKYAFGQHSGVIDLNKDKFELPRFPINEKYGELKRFRSIINYFPLEYKRILPEEKQLFENTNPPNFKVEFFKEQKNLSNINCYSNEGDVWEKSKTNFANNSLTIEFREPFKPRRGRINCSLNDDGIWRWFGIQFPIKEN